MVYDEREYPITEEEIYDIDPLLESADSESDVGTREERYMEDMSLVRLIIKHYRFRTDILLNRLEKLGLIDRVMKFRIQNGEVYPGNNRKRYNEIMRIISLGEAKEGIYREGDHRFWTNLYFALARKKDPSSLHIKSMIKDRIIQRYGN